MPDQIQQYELGGVRFVVIDGDVYCRYADVFDEEDGAQGGGRRRGRS